MLQSPVELPWYSDITAYLSQIQVAISDFVLGPYWMPFLVGVGLILAFRYGKRRR